MGSNLGLEIQVMWFGWGVVILNPLRLYSTFHFMSIDGLLHLPFTYAKPISVL
ncbi:hypothetical protein AALO_G00162730 [Alosa alosa]|uniref:Uncharacterized protein n=1 Tax=Alosa alosa TaxID=278164 RepID=A0AAV6GAS5_9TELE|nr:hypothetical protein AALO_G00162730 [Alosa alosa]